VAVNADNLSIDYTPAANFNGTEVITYTVSDGTLTDATGTFTITVTAVNDAPIALDISSATIVNTTVSIPLVGKDTDYDAISYVIITLPSKGQLKDGEVVIESSSLPKTLSSENVFFVPNEDYKGNDSFTYKVNDGALDSSEKKVAIKVSEGYLDEQTKLGLDIDGQANDYQGQSISFNEDATIMAVGANEHDGKKGTVRVYKREANTWTQVGSDIDGTEANDSQGFSVSLSGDGLILAVGATGHDSNKGTSRIYKFDADSWTQIGTDLDGIEANDYQGSSVSLSKDGTTLAVGAYGHDSNKGTVRIYQYDTSIWSQIGLDLDGNSADNYQGRSVSLSGDGLTLAIGATGVESNKGSASVYKYDSTTWNKLGEDILGTDAEDYLGNSISLSARGTTLAVGAWGHDSYKGTAKVYRYASSNWSQVGVDLDGELANDYQGWSVSLSSNGMTLAVGAYGHQENKGTVKIYNIAGENTGSANKGSITLNTQISTWLQIGDNIDGEDSSPYRMSSSEGLDGETGDKQGYSVSMSSDGITLAVGALGHDNNKGTVRAYSLIKEGPTAFADISTVLEDSSLVSIDVIANDTDGDGDTLFLTAANTSGTGTVAVNADGVSVDYTPAADFNGTEVITYTASDGVLTDTTGTLTMTITAVNDTPVVVDQSLNTIEDITLIVALTGTDIELDTLTYTIVDNPTNGTVSLTDNKATYVPSAGYFGSDSFTFKVNDGTVDSEKGTISIIITSNDLDGDGVLNDVDECPNTPQGYIVDLKGCTVFTLPSNNNKVEVTSASCIGTSDGSIGLSVEDASFDYSITVTGKDPIAISGENKTASVTGLAKGTYTVCFNIVGQEAYEQCFEVVIGEPKSLSAFIDVDNDKKTTSIQLSGSQLYNIEVNGQRFEVKGDNFTTSLPTGLSIIKISTNLDCQGVIEKEVFISEDIHYYPNPTPSDVSVHISGEDTRVLVSVFSEKGDLIYSKEQQIQDFSRKTNIDLSLQITGTYLVVMEGPTVRKTFKIVKK